MTREETEDLLAMIKVKEPNELIVNSWWGSFVKDYKEALQMAIKTLEQEPCEDCISRQAVLDINEHHHGQMPNHVNYEIWKEINALPSVTPKEKTGKWRHYEGMLICSECGAEFYDDIMEYCGDDIPKCCPNCGAKMIEPQESEDKE